MEDIAKFAGSPRNKYGTHSSAHGFKGSYEKAWRLHFSQIGGGSLGVASGGPIRGTVRRVSMIAAGMKPPCKLPPGENVKPRGGAPSPLAGSYPERPKDYGLSQWAKPSEDDLTREDLTFSCSDLAIIKRTALAEIRRRAEDRAKREEARSKKADGVADPDVLQQFDMVIPDCHYLHPFLTDDWQQCVAEHAQVDKALLVLSPPDPEAVTPEQLAKAVTGARAQWLLEAPCTACALDAFAKVGRPYTLAGAPDRLFCSSFSVGDLGVEWMGKSEPVRKPFAGFADFQACIDAQLKDGKSQESAESICGALQREAEAEKIGKLLDALPDEIRIFKANDGDGDEGYVLGIVLEPEPFDGKGDAQGEVYSATEVRKAAHRWVAEAQRLGLMHEQILEGAVLADSFVIPEESTGLTVGKTTIKAGTWLLGFYLDKSRPEWPAIKRGDFTGLSIGGMARRRPA